MKYQSIKFLKVNPISIRVDDRCKEKLEYCKDKLELSGTKTIEKAIEVLYTSLNSKGA